ncbi:MAG TPA: metallophosphoesterase [Gemmataceae bacterium]|jgi:3',5'-cyclic AMP phosphodiesterase CpdA
MAVFRLLHASDLHFARVPRQIGLPDLRHAWASRVSGTWAPVSSHGPIYADAFAAFVYANRNGLDAIFLSGDVATTGDPGDLRPAHRFLHAPAAAGYLSVKNRPTLQAANKPIVLLPGNHDRFGSFHLPGKTSFDKVFAQDWKARQGCQLLWMGQRRGAALALIGVDFSLRPRDAGSVYGGLPLLGFLGQGRIYAARLQRLRLLTRSVQQKYPGCTLLWGMHFEPSAADPSLALLDDHLLSQALQQERVAAILCGHTHAGRIKDFAGTPVYVCGTTTQYASVQGNHFHVLEIDIRPSAPARLKLISFRYDPASGQFIAETAAGRSP